MSTISSDKLQNIYTNLTNQISESIRNISYKQEEKFVPFGKETTQENKFSSVYGTQSFAVSYLEPKSLYSLQLLVQNFSEEENINKKQRNEEQVSDNQERKTKASIEVEELPFQTSFMDEIYNYKPAPDSFYVSSVYKQNLTHSSSIINMNSGMEKSILSNVKYATQTYAFNYNINNEPQVRLDLLHKNNRSFDYRI